MKSSTVESREIAPDSAIMQLVEVVKVYQGSAGAVVALKGVNLSVRQGEFLVIMGRSGSGKTTLVNCLTGLDRCTSGQIHVAGTAVHRLGAEQASRWRRRNVGVVFQSFELLPTLTATENVMLPMDFARAYPPSAQRKRAMELLEAVEIAEHARKMPAALSGGQQQRLAIARALANDPPILVADEPTGSLDSATADEVIHLFERLVRAGKTVVLVTHDKDVAAHASRTVKIADGTVIQDESGNAAHA